MFEIEVQDRFNAAHFLKLYDGSWENRHSHDWKVSVVLRSKELDRIEVVADFEEVKKNLKKVLMEFDNKCFNALPTFRRKNSSTENIAYLIFSRLSRRLKTAPARIFKVTVWETEDASASYYP